MFLSIGMRNKIDDAVIRNVEIFETKDKVIACTVDLKCQFNSVKPIGSTEDQISYYFSLVPVLSGFV
ncbi:hypothetical protein BSQ33_07200 [Vibrio gazogenes]|uniref:Uncharacterized protein n=1 Tax=Vibrio gazogenes TaxID=687 RepID=A0A1Z2SED7_VIBGA|nr:hypothetical protein BSQ33_07200 [Vibrio gazogenes]